MLLVLMDFYALTSLPEMLFSASASAVAASVKASRKDYHKGGDLERFCKEQVLFSICSDLFLHSLQ